MNFRGAVGALALAITGCPGSSPAASCSTDLDCRETARCVEGRCVLEIADAAFDAPENATLIITVDGPDAAIDAPAGPDAGELVDAAAVVDAQVIDAPSSPDAHPRDAGADSWVPGPILCTLWPQAGCGPGEGCYPAPDRGTQCVPPTASGARAGEGCMFTNDCRPGLFCGALGHPSPVCETVCPLEGSRCATCVDVVEYGLPPGFGVCG